MKTEAPEVVLLAGGKGTRLKSVTGSLPKVLVPVAGRTVLDWKLEQLATNGVRKVHILIGYQADLIEEHLHNQQLPLEIETHRDGPRLLGTGGAISAQVASAIQVRHHLRRLIADEPLAPFWRSFTAGRFPAMLVVTQQFDSEMSGNVALANDRVRRYAKDPTDSTLDWLDYGYLAIRRDVFSDFREAEPFDLGELISRLASQGDLGAYLASNPFWEVGTPSSLRVVEGHLTQRLS